MRVLACSYTGTGLFYKMQTSFGHLTAGFGATNHTYPLVFGETGSFYTSVRTHQIAIHCLASEVYNQSMSTSCGSAGRTTMLYGSYHWTLQVALV